MARKMEDITARKKEHSGLESQISQLIKKESRMEASIASIVTNGTATEVSTLSRAGDSFGGRSEKEQKRINGVFGR